MAHAISVPDVPKQDYGQTPAQYEHRDTPVFLGDQHIANRANGYYR